MAKKCIYKLIRRSDKYKYVSLYKKKSPDGFKEVWIADLRHASGGNRSTRPYETEKEAAIAIDLELIKRGKEPINVLTRKKP